MTHPICKRNLVRVFKYILLGNQERIFDCMNFLHGSPKADVFVFHFNIRKGEGRRMEDVKREEKEGGRRKNRGLNRIKKITLKRPDQPSSNGT